MDIFAGKSVAEKEPYFELAASRRGQVLPSNTFVEKVIKWQDLTPIF